MAGLLDLFSGRSSDIYGAGLLTPEQRGGLGNIGLLALAGKLGQLAGPSFSPVPDFGAALGQAAGAYGASQEGAGTAALNAILTGQKGRKLEQELEYSKQLGPILAKLAGQWPGGDGSAGGGEGSGSTGGGGAAAPLSAGGDVGSDPSETDIIGRESGGKPYVGYGGVDLSNKPLNQFGFPIWEGRMGPAGISHAAGLYQFQPGTWATYAGPLGIKDFSPESQRKVYLAARAAEGARPWAASAGGGGGRAAAAPAAPAPVGTGTSGLLNLPQVPNAARDVFGGVTPDASAAAVLGQGASAEPPGFAGRQLVAQLLTRPAIKDVSQYQQVAGPGGGDAPGGMASGLLAPGGPLSRGGVPGLPAMPAAAPSADPSLQLGPLAAPAPAAAAPAAPGPGMPAAPALPRVNPAYDEYLRNVSAAAALAKGAGLPDVLSPLIEGLTKSPAYRAQQIIAEKTAAQPFEQAQTLYNKQVEIAGVGPIEAAKLPYALAQEYFKADQQIRSAGPVAAAQNFERIKADNAAKGIITTMGADGQIKLSIDPDAVRAVTAATVTAPKQAEADIVRETTQQQQFGERKGNWRQVDVPGGGKVWVDANGRLITGANGNPYQAQEDPAAQAGRTKLAEQFGQGTIDQLRSAEDAQFGLQNTARVRPLIDKMIAGYGADTRLEFGRALKAAGLSDGDGVVATQTYLINQLDQASRIAKRFGSGAGITERDVENAKQLAGGSAQLDKQSLLNILDMVDRANRRALELQHQGYDRLTDGGKTPVDRSLYKVPIPIYNPQQMQSLPPGTPILMPDGHSDVVPARK